MSGDFGEITAGGANTLVSVLLLSSVLLLLLLPPAAASFALEFTVEEEEGVTGDFQQISPLQRRRSSRKGSFGRTRSSFFGEAIVRRRGEATKRERKKKSR